MVRFHQWTKIHAFYRFLVRLPSWKKIEISFFFLIYSHLVKRRIGNNLKGHVGGNSYFCYCDYHLFYLIWAGNNETLRILLSCVHLFTYMSVLVSVGLFEIHFKFSKLVITRFARTFESKNDKNAVINIGWVRLSFDNDPKLFVRCQIADKKIIIE